MAKTKKPAWKQARQGDVLTVKRLAGAPADLGKEIPPENGRVVLAKGELHGHTHALDAVKKGRPAARLFEAPEQPGLEGIRRMYLQVMEPQPQEHEEHGPVPYEEPGFYEIRTQRIFVRGPRAALD